MNIRNILFAAALILLLLFTFNYYGNYSEFLTPIAQSDSNNFIINVKSFLSGIINKKDNYKQENVVEKENAILTSNQNNIEEKKTIELSKLITIIEEYVLLTENTLPINEAGFENNIIIGSFISNINRSDFLKVNSDIKFSLIILMRTVSTAKVTFKNLYLRDSNLKSASKTSLESDQDFVEKQKMRTQNMNNDFNNQKEKFRKELDAGINKVRTLALNRNAQHVARSDKFVLSLTDLFEDAKKNKWIAENSKVLLLRIDSIEGNILTATELRPVVIGGGRVSKMASIGGGDGGGVIVYEPTGAAVTVTGIPSKLKGLKRCSIKVYPEVPLNSKQTNKYVFIKLIPNNGL